MEILRGIFALVIIYGAINGNITTVIIGFVGLLGNYMNDKSHKGEAKDDKQINLQIDGADNSEDRIPCPFCAEQILRKAKVCRFCNKEIHSVDVAKSQLSDMQKYI